MINKITLVGHVGQDPEVRRLENGTPVGRFSIATSENYKDAAGDWQSQTEWHNVVVWRSIAEQAEKVLKKGSLVFVEGKLTHRKFTDKNGIERIATDVVASLLRSLDKREGGGGAGIREASFPTQEPVMATGGKSNGSEPTIEVVAPMGDAPLMSDDLPF